MLIIPFENNITLTWKKNKVLAFKLRSYPTNDALLTYDLTIPFLEAGTAENLFEFLKNMEKIIIGQHVHDPVGQ